MNKQNRISYQERKEIFKLLKQGDSCGIIASKIGRSKNAVVVEVRRTGGKESYDPKKAQQESEKRKELGDAKRWKNGKIPENPWISMKTRIENLEFQVEILTDIIKDLKENKNDKDK